MRFSPLTINLEKQYISNTVLISVVWLVGLLFGALCLKHGELIERVQILSYCRGSILGLFFVIFFPLVFSYIICKKYSIRIVLPLVFTKAVSFVCCLGSLMISFGSAGWLVCGLLLSSDILVVVILLLLWFRTSTSRRDNVIFEIVSYIILPVAIGCFDYFIISPYASMLLNY